MVILVCGASDDSQIALLARSLKRKAADFLVLEEEAMADEVQLRWQIVDRGLTGKVRVGSRLFDVHGISGVYHRFVNPEDLFDSTRHANKTRSVLRALMDLLDVLPTRVVNRRRSMMSNNSKPYQALLIRQAGFMVPETLVTNDDAALQKFASKVGPLVYKSISSARSVVAPLDEKALEKIGSLRYLPTQFQRRIAGLNVRVHVVGRRLFATQALTTALDYRYASTEGVSVRLKPYELTLEWQRRCLHLARLCGLAFTGIDMIVSEQGVYCLEVNPSPGYSYYQEATGQRISDALAAYLMKA
ncbi:MAG: RimK family alpha-L-glutamate ligase [Candidatus Bathyarchaeia archaeon]